MDCIDRDKKGVKVDWQFFRVCLCNSLATPYRHKIPLASECPVIRYDVL